MKEGYHLKFFLKLNFFQVKKMMDFYAIFVIFCQSAAILSENKISKIF